MNNTNNEYPQVKYTLLVTEPGETSKKSSDKLKRSFDFTLFPFNTWDYSEIKKLFRPKLFCQNITLLQPEDKWQGLNEQRAHVASSLNQGLFELIYKYSKEDDPIIEIGSSRGYSTWEKLLPTLIRTQMCFSECFYLSAVTIDPIYQMSIEEIYESLITSDIKIPLFFGLNVFDMLSPEARMKSLSQIAELQKSGDHLLILSDTNPSFDEFFKKLEEIYPEHLAMPYLPLELNSVSKMSFVLMPRGKVNTKVELIDYLHLIYLEYDAIKNGFITSLQQKIHAAQIKHNFPIIVLEDFFAEQMKKELMEAGYKTHIYYHTAFTTGAANLNEPLDLIYKPVTDIVPVRQWSLDNHLFLDSLKKKDIRFPAYFNEKFLSELKPKGHKIFGAEILVIEATKL